MEGNNEEVPEHSEVQVGQPDEQQPIDREFSSEDEYYQDEIDSFSDDYLYDELGNEDISGSEPKPLGGLYQLFDTVYRAPISTKVSNLNKEELGDLGISVRESMRIALLANTFHHPIFAKFFMNQAGIISDSAMSKGGWFTELFVTSKKYASRESSSDVKNLPEFKKGKWKMFSGKNKQ